MVSEVSQFSSQMDELKVGRCKGPNDFDKGQIITARRLGQRIISWLISIII